MVLATAVVTALAVGVGSLTGSRAVTLTAIIGWQTVASGMLYLATFLGAARDLVLVFAVSRFQPGPAIGTRANPGSTNASTTSSCLCRPSRRCSSSSPG